MILFQLNKLDNETSEAIRINNDQYVRREIDSHTHEEKYEMIMQHWRMEMERIL